MKHELPVFAVPQTPAMQTLEETYEERFKKRKAMLRWLRRTRTKFLGYKMHLSVYEIDNRIHQLRVSNKVDKELTYWYRQSMVDGNVPKASEIFRQRGALVNEWNYKFTKEEKANVKANRTPTP